MCIASRGFWYGLLLVCLLEGILSRTPAGWTPHECWCSRENRLDISEGYFYFNNTFLRASKPSGAKKYNFNNRISGPLPDVGDVLDNHPGFTKTIPYRLKLVSSPLKIALLLNSSCWITLKHISDNIKPGGKENLQYLFTTKTTFILSLHGLDVLKIVGNQIALTK